MKDFITSLILILIIFSSSSYSNEQKKISNEQKKFWITKHFECVSPYLDEIKAIKNYRTEKNKKSRKNKKRLDKIINNFNNDYLRAIADNKINHYLKKANSLRSRSKKIYTDQLVVDRYTANTNLLVPDFCYIAVKAQLSQFHRYDINKHIIDLDLTQNGLKNSAILLVSSLLTSMTDLSFSQVSLAGYTNQLKTYSRLLSPFEYLNCYENIGYEGKKYSSILKDSKQKIMKTFNSDEYQKYLDEIKKIIGYSVEVLVDRQSVDKSYKSAVYVSDNHPYYRLKKKHQNNRKYYINLHNSFINDLNRHMVAVYFQANETNHNEQNINAFQEAFICNTSAKRRSKIPIVDGTLSTAELRKKIRAINKSIRTKE